MKTLDLRGSGWLKVALLVVLIVLAVLAQRGDGLGFAIDAVEAGGAAAFLIWGAGHCDTLDGPVVSLARKALELGNVNLVLPWVREDDEAAIRGAFDHALAVRKLGPDARELADTHFFETLVRVHRASEGAPYTGLKPAGLDLGPAVPLADRVLESGSLEKLEKLLGDAVRHGLHARFEAARRLRAFDPDDVRAGRRFVQAYVPYVHYVERLWDVAHGDAHSHHAHAAAPEVHAAH